MEAKAILLRAIRCEASIRLEMAAAAAEMPGRTRLSVKRAILDDSVYFEGNLVNEMLWVDKSIRLHSKDGVFFLAANHDNCIVI